MESPKVNIKGKSVSLGELTPEASTFNITTPDGKELSLTLRPITLKDDQWIQRELGEKTFNEALQTQEMSVVSKFVYHQLVIDSKRLVKEIKLIDMDEDGNEFEVECNGPEKLLHLIAGYKNGYAMFSALMQARGLSLPVFDAMVEDEIKKNETQVALEKSPVI